MTIEQQINSAKDGRTARWIITKLGEHGYEMSDYTFHMKKRNNKFTKEELTALSKILGVKIIAPATPTK